MKIALATAAAALVCVGGGAAFAASDNSAEIGEVNGILTLFTDQGTWRGRGECHYARTKSGNATVNCRLDQTNDTDLGSAVVAKGWRCATRLGVTFDTKATLTPSGGGVATCKYRDL